MIKTVARYHHWTPDVLNGLYLDDMDHFGLEYWYLDVLEVIKELESNPKA
jgi:hypothetical protein